MKTVIKAVVMAGLLAGGMAYADGAKTYAKKCASCHGKDGKGATKMGKKLGAKDMTDAKTQAGFTDEEAIKTLNEGLKSDKGEDLMDPYKDELSADEIKAVVEYVRTFKK